MPQTFSLTDNPASINYIEVNVNRADGTSTSPGADGDNWTTLKQSDDMFIGNRKYLIIVNARVGGNDASLLYSFRVTQDHDGSNITPTMSKEPVNYSMPHSYNCAEIITPSVDTKINFQAKSHDASSWAKLYYLRIVALDITDLREGLDYFHSTDSTAAEHTSIFAERIAYIMDDDSTGVPSEQITDEGDGLSQAVGKWLILATSLMDVDGDGTSEDSYGMRVNYGPGEYHRGSLTYSLPTRSLSYEEGRDVDERAVAFSATTETVWRGLTLQQVAYKFVLKTADPLGSLSPNSYVSSTLIGINLSRFKDVNTGFTSSSTTISAADEITIDTWSRKPSNDGKGFIIACGIADINNSEQSFWVGLDQDDVDVFDLGTGVAPNHQAAAGRSSDSSDQIGFIAMGIVDLDSGSTHEYKVQYNPLTATSTEYERYGYAMCSLTYDHEDFYDDKVDVIKIGEVRRRRSSPTIPTIG